MLRRLVLYSSSRRHALQTGRDSSTLGSSGSSRHSFATLISNDDESATNSSNCHEHDALPQHRYTTLPAISSSRNRSRNRNRSGSRSFLQPWSLPQHPSIQVQVQVQVPICRYASTLRSQSSSLSLHYQSHYPSHYPSHFQSHYQVQFQKEFQKEYHSYQTVYVSKHYEGLQLSHGVIEDFCHGQGLVSKRSPKHVILRDCPFCTKPTKGLVSNQNKIYIDASHGAYWCHRCGAKGSWYDFKARLNGGYAGLRKPTGGTSGSSSGGGTMMGAGGRGRGDDDDPTTPGNRSFGSASPNRHQHHPPPTATAYSRNGNSNRGSPSQQQEAPLPLPQSRLSSVYSSRLLDPQHKGNQALEYLQTERGLTPKTLRLYGVGRASYNFASDSSSATHTGGYEQAECVTFPWILLHSELAVQESLRGVTIPPPQPPARSTPQTIDTSTTEKDTTENADNNDNNNDSNKDSNDKDSNDKTKKETTNASANAKDEAPSTTTTTTNRDPFVTRRIKVRALKEKGWQRLDPAGGGWGLFGLHTVPADATEVVLTEGEYDAMAVTQATGRPAISLPNGCRSLPIEVLPLLERFETIYLWMDNDLPGQEGAQKFTKKLGLKRTHIVMCREAKDANEALLKGLDLNRYLEEAGPVPHEKLVQFGDLRAEVIHEILEPDLYCGSPIQSLPKFTQLIKGFRRGEMTVLTGPTGSGKTTFLGQVSLDLAEQGANILWGSFEIKNTRLLQKMLKQYSRQALPDKSDPDAVQKLNALADKFESLPLHFMRFHGGSDVDEVLDAMEYAVYVNDTEHIILDNMQFMITRNVKGGSTWDKFDVQDIAIEKFRKFATEHDVHVTLVVHPRKEDESAKLNISSFYGSAKATQEADTVLILQNDANRRKYIEVKKNRFDGTLGHAPLYFEPKSGRYVDNEAPGGVPPKQNNGNGNGNGNPNPMVFRAAKKGWIPPGGESEPEPEPEGLEHHWDNIIASGPPR